MENFTISFSQKNIPVLFKRQYILLLISKVEKVIKPMRLLEIIKMSRKTSWQ